MVAVSPTPKLALLLVIAMVGAAVSPKRACTWLIWAKLVEPAMSVLNAAILARVWGCSPKSLHWVVLLRFSVACELGCSIFWAKLSKVRSDAPASSLVPDWSSAMSAASVPS